VFFNRFSWPATSRDPQSRQVYKLIVPLTVSNIEVFFFLNWRLIHVSDWMMRSKLADKRHIGLSIAASSCALESGK
jgi:hypothetical protein